MLRRAFGWTGIEVPVIGQGTWELEKVSRPQAVAAIRAGLEAGMTHIDTAEMYGSGHVESLVGEAIEGRRDEVFLVSKVLPDNGTRDGVVAACEQSLTRLGTDHLDVYLLHWPGAHPLEETIRGFEDLRAAGKIRFWGVSNFDVKDLEEALRIAGENAIACNQVLYHLSERAIEHDVLTWCESHHVPVVAYSPFGSGQFPSPRSEGRRVLERIARAHGVSVRQVALRFLTLRDSIFAIPRSAVPEHVSENAGASRLELDAADIAAIDEAFPLGPKKALPML